MSIDDRAERDYPVPEDESERLAALKRYDILDTPPEENFDRLTRLATDLFEVPIALISLIDENRQWFKSCVGVDRRSTDRGLAFCNVPLVKQETVVIPDATQDDRFKENPLVTGEMNIRSYAGAPLITEEGYALGTFCIIDTKPRDFDNQQLEKLEILAEEVMSQIELRRKRRELEETNRLLHLRDQAVDAANEGITISDPTQPDNPIIYANQGFEEISGYDREEIAGRNCRVLQGPDTEEETVEQIREAIDNEESISVRLKNYRKDGEPFWNDLSITPVFDENDELSHFVGVQRDVTSIKQYEQRLEEKARFDQLTGLLDRSEYLKLLETEFTRLQRYQHESSVLMLDLDHFKSINDTHGHLAGDKVLETVGTILSESCRENDFAGRYGGEEFGVYLPETAAGDAKNFATRVLEAIRSRTFQADGTAFSVTASMGISPVLPDDESISDALQRADEALYQAKQNGRDRFCLHEPQSV